ncbi:DUF2993 domain-containing protein [Streptomyces sp. N2-109]|uniref:DUF2993 domain-containing protein n=1 Tax=Streptomyces gossypii TaxID=2883101 RepID=A0ABT2JY60_9ACTN|nr:DUF2993 domain-containing protein [Streptomyces gossypii]MCT2592829.1 DUF2993 domain-containing protein [Streptomyces gossypii]
MRALRISLIIFVVLAVLFIAADRIAVNMAESEAAEKVRTTQGLDGAESASVSINGFPFLTQVMGKELGDVDVEMTGLTASAGNRRISVTRVEAHLTDVKLEGNFDSAVAKEASGSADISYKDLNALAPDGVRVAYAGKERADKNQVKITASVQVLGQQVEIPSPIYSTVKITGKNELELHAESIPASGVPGAEGEIRERVDFGSPIAGLPDGLELKETDATEEGVTFALEGTDVELAG